MRKLLVAAVLLTGAAIHAPSFAAQGTEAGEAEADMDQVVCRRENVIGSRVRSRRVCKTRREWVRDADSSRQSMDDLIRRARGAADISG